MSSMLAAYNKVGRGVSLYSHSCDRTQSTVNGQTIRISAVNGPSGVGQRSNPSAERTRLVLQPAPNLAVGLHMRGTLISLFCLRLATL